MDREVGSQLEWQRKNSLLSQFCTHLGDDAGGGAVSWEVASVRCQRYLGLNMCFVSCYKYICLSLNISNYETRVIILTLEGCFEDKIR